MAPFTEEESGHKENLHSERLAPEYALYHNFAGDMLK